MDQAPDRLAAKIADVEGVRAVKRLQHAWAHYAEAGDFAAMADLFAHDGRLVLPPDEASGREAILALIRATMGGDGGGLGPDHLNVRLFLSPVVTMDADGAMARGRWHEVAMTGQHGARAHWSGGIHENEYVREDGVWRLRVMRYHPQYAGSYEDGWRNLTDAVPPVPFHYDPERAGTPVPLAPTERAMAPGDRDGLAERARALIDEGSIQNLQAAYGYYLDRRMWPDVADLFAEDGFLEVVDEGRYEAREGIARALGRFGPAGLRTGQLNDHLQLMPVVTLSADGESAAVRAIELRMVGEHGGKSSWGVAVCEARCVRSGDAWQFAAMRLSPRMLADYDSGWGHALPPLPGPSNDYPPDAPSPGPTAYPTHTGPAITFPHPVLGRPTPPTGGGDADPEVVGRNTSVALARDAVENIACAYGYYIDEACWDEAADLFAADGWKELSYVGTFIGRERVRWSMATRYGRTGRRPTFLAIHQKTQPYVTVAADGQSAQMRLRLFQINSAWNAGGSMIAGLYEEQAKIEDGVWKIHGMDLEYIVMAPYAGGWARVDPHFSQSYAPAPEDLAKLPPDGPLRGLAFAPFPDIGPIGFHFANPASGRAPALFFQWSDGRFG